MFSNYLTALVEFLPCLCLCLTHEPLHHHHLGDKVKSPRSFQTCCLHILALSLATFSLETTYTPGISGHCLILRHSPRGFLVPLSFFLPVFLKNVLKVSSTSFLTLYFLESASPNKMYTPYILGKKQILASFYPLMWLVHSRHLRGTHWLIDWINERCHFIHFHHKSRSWGFSGEGRVKNHLWKSIDVIIWWNQEAGKRKECFRKKERMHWSTCKWYALSLRNNFLTLHVGLLWRPFGTLNQKLPWLATQFLSTSLSCVCVSVLAHLGENHPVHFQSPLGYVCYLPAPLHPRLQRAVSSVTSWV